VVVVVAVVVVVVVVAVVAVVVVVVAVAGTLDTPLSVVAADNNCTVGAGVLVAVAIAIVVVAGVEAVVAVAVVVVAVVFVDRSARCATEPQDTLRALAAEALPPQAVQRGRLCDHAQTTCAAAKSGFSFRVYRKKKNRVKIFNIK